MTIYSDQFYLNQVSGAYNSGKVYANLFSKIYVPTSVIDIGCGRGAWLRAFKEIATGFNIHQKSIGVDGPWNSKDNLIIKDIDYHSVDLNDLKSLKISDKFDLVISVETAEHIRAESTVEFIKKLCSLSDVVIFSGAFEGQGGLYHINEREHSNWADLFINNNFFPYDLFRPSVWGLSDVNYWYQQNVFLYVKNDTALAQRLSEMNINKIQNLKFMDCLHPQAFKERSSLFGHFKHAAQKILPSSLVLFASNLKKKIA